MSKLSVEEYKAKRESRIERLKARADRLREFAKGKDLSLYGESKTGIPLGQPILIGHHSERRHRRHIERIDRIVRSGYAALDKAEVLDSRVENAESNRAIMSDDPEAVQQIKHKIETLERFRDSAKEKRALARKGLLPEGEKVPEHWQLTNTGAEIRRLKARLVEIERADNAVDHLDFTLNDVMVCVNAGQVQVRFKGKPSAATRDVLKRSPLALKWSSYSKAWVRKHTATTAGSYFIKALRDVIEGVEYE